jgi:hypothetical protein
MRAVELSYFPFLELFCLEQIDSSAKRFRLFLYARVASVKTLFDLLTDSPGQDRGKHILDMCKALRSYILIVSLPEDSEGVA